MTGAKLVRTACLLVAKAVELGRKNAALSSLTRYGLAGCGGFGGRGVVSGRLGTGGAGGAPGADRSGVCTSVIDAIVAPESRRTAVTNARRQLSVAVLSPGWSPAGGSRIRCTRTPRRSGSQRPIEAAAWAGSAAMRILASAGATVGRPRVASQISVIPRLRSCEIAASRPIRFRPSPYAASRRPGGTRRRCEPGWRQRGRSGHFLAVLGRDTHASSPVRQPARPAQPPGV